jgi:hypothetical protein
LLTGYVRYCPGGSFHFTAYSQKLMEGRFSEAQSHDPAVHWP